MDSSLLQLRVLERLHLWYYFEAPASHLDNLNLIISPDYTVTKTEKKTNHWNKKWTWDLETRAHHIIFDISIDDHHGDYIHGKCYTHVRVNEVRG